ncbi:hypothetical protein BD410DRAFT_846246 [Rickenella mellea]|uniref:Uncharacterized protein n=1 Tax=Rickenella mellea TaxID=50990 RepID=A0A4Y7PG98_9AGAM|nr:hypothetical protein BD410DRAFT_846246 [Rickenella mellea]
MKGVFSLLSSGWPFICLFDFVGFLILPNVLDSKPLGSYQPGEPLSSLIFSFSIEI